MMYYNDAADYSTVTPRIRERSILAPKPGSSFEGPLSLLTQFSAWPLAATHQIIGKTLYESLTKGRAVWVLGTALALSTISGHIRREARDRLAGRPPESPRNAWDLGFMLLRDAAAGGLLGVVGEHLIGSIGQQVQQGSTPIGGPFVGDLARLSEIGYQYAHSLATTGKYDPWPDLVHMATGKVPFANLFYTKGAIDYLAWYHLYEAASPGWWERTNKAIKAERGKGMAGYMPGAPIPYTPLTPIIGAFQ
jgi:hypothetical protein